MAAPSSERAGERLAAFVTVGNATQGFPRLLHAVETWLAAEAPEGRVVAQIGNNPGFSSDRMECVAFLPVAVFLDHLERAEVVVAHAGAGTLIHAIGLGKTPVVMARRAERGEIIDDHQLELVAALAREGRVLAAPEAEDLPRAIAEARLRQASAVPRREPPLLALVGQALEQLGRRGAGR